MPFAPDGSRGPPLEVRIRAIKAFDLEYLRGARFLERTFELVGLPTLATAVRPHLKGTGRVGRPSKRAPEDKHPDLVREVLAAGLLPAPIPIASEQAKPERTARPRRRVVFGVASFRPMTPAGRRRKVRRRPEPESRAKLATRRRGTLLRYVRAEVCSVARSLIVFSPAVYPCSLARCPGGSPIRHNSAWICLPIRTRRRRDRPMTARHHDDGAPPARPEEV